MNYFLNTPVKRNVWVPPKDTFVSIAPHSGQETQDHHRLTWLHHKPQNHAIFPVAPLSGRKK
jgi:hypothetical protein